MLSNIKSCVLVV